MTAITAPRRSRWIPWVFVAGFGIVIGVNGVLITAAVRTYTGTTTVGAYDRGRTYGDVLAEAERQRGLGWQAETTLRDGAVVATLRLPDGAPMPADATVTGTLQRPLDRESLSLSFAPSAAGTWRAPVEAAPGIWEAVLTATRGADRLEWRQRVIVP